MQDRIVISYPAAQPEWRESNAGPDRDLTSGGAAFGIKLDLGVWSRLRRRM